MRAVSWFLGIALGLIAVGAVLVAGVFALLLLVPAVVWAARETARPLGLGGVFIGLGAGSAGLVALADARCTASNVSTPDAVSGCMPPDLTAYFVTAALVAVIGVVVSLVGIARMQPRSA
jgi:hypothetical protein